jgi:hypothetical protein
MLNLATSVQSASRAVFGLGGDIVKSATYVRPPQYQPATGAVLSAEIRAACSIVVGEVPGRLVGGFIKLAPMATVLIRASELVAISSPAKGDYIEQANGTRRLVVETPRTDPTATLYVFKTEISFDLDWGDLAAPVSSEDWGGLTTPASFEDWGAAV